jgi:DNA polymerase I
MTKSKRLLVDADILAYRSSFSVEEALEVEPGYWTWHCDFNKVIGSIKETLQYFQDLLDTEDYELCLSDDNENFRKALLPEYKEKRVRVKRPLVLKEVRRWMVEEEDAIILPGLEGDDVMGILSTTEDDFDDIIVSMDKDMKTIPGKFYRNAEDGLVNISEQEADYWHLYQTLTGDTTDGYGGCPGVGGVKAKKALDEAPTWPTVASLFAKAGLDEEYALTQARMARILRASDWSYEEMKVKLWTP